MLDFPDAWIHDKFDKLDERIDELQKENDRLRGRVQTLEQVVLVLSVDSPRLLSQHQEDAQMEVGPDAKYPYWPTLDIVLDGQWMLKLDYSGGKS